MSSEQPQPESPATQADALATRGPSQSFPHKQALPAPPRHSPTIWAAKLGVFVLLLVIAYVAQSILIPIMGAVLLGVTLSPAVRWLSKHGVSRYISAVAFALLVSGFSFIVLITTALMIGSWIENAPIYMDRVGDRLETYRAPIDNLSQAAEALEGDGATTLPDPTSDTEGQPKPLDEVKPKLPQVPASSPTNISFWMDIAGTVMGQSISILAGFFICIVLTFFFLLSGEVFLAKLLSLAPSLTGKKEVMSIVREIEKEISHFLGVWTLINVAVGLVVWIAFEVLGVPNAWLWGVSAMLFNYVPYAGPWVLGAAALIMGLMTFDKAGPIILPAVVILTVNVIEGFIISPMLHGRRLKLNTVAVFLSVVLGGWLWGIAGALMAVPVLVMVYVVCSHLPSLQPVALFLDDSAPGLNREPGADKGDASSDAAPSLSTGE